jgi:hypothetical protein
MERIYIHGDSACFTRKDLTLVDVELKDGTKFENLEPKRLFPVSMQDKYITLLDESGTEQAVIRDINTLPDDQRAILEGCLDEYYRVPKILRIRAYEERFDGLTLHTDTDKGSTDIEIRVLLKGFKLDGVRALLRDVNDNRYEIPDVTALDNLSKQILGRYL